MFIERFGYGCVTRLDLTSGSAFQIDVKYSETSLAASSKYRLGGSISSPGGAVVNAATSVTVKNAI